MRRRVTAAALLAIAVLATACRSSDSSDPTAAPGQPSPTPAPVTLHLGYFPNFTHAPAIVGLARGTFKEALGPNVTIDTKTFNAGPRRDRQRSSPATSTSATSARARRSTAT